MRQVDVILGFFHRVVVIRAVTIGAVAIHAFVETSRRSAKDGSNEVDLGAAQLPFRHSNLLEARDIAHRAQDDSVRDLREE